MNYMNRVLKWSVVFLLVFAVILPSSIGNTIAEAKTTKTKNEVKKKIDEYKNKISTAEKEIKNLSDKRDRLEKEYNQKKEGLIYVSWLTDVTICESPLVIKSLSYVYFGNATYYYVEDNNYINGAFPGATGYIKKTGGTKTIYVAGTPYTCIVCKSVKAPDNSALEKAEKDLKKKQSDLSSYKSSKELLEQALDDRLYINDTQVGIGKTKKIQSHWKYSGKYNEITWKSSNKKVATVDKNGKVTGIKQGTATITATCGVSGNSESCQVTVNKPIENITFEQSEYIAYIEDADKGFEVVANIYPTNSTEKISISTKGNSVSFMSTTEAGKGKINIHFYILKKGTTKCTISTDSGEKYTFSIKVVNRPIPEAESSEIIDSTVKCKSEGSDYDDWIYKGSIKFKLLDLDGKVILADLTKKFEYYSGFDYPLWADDDFCYYEIDSVSCDKEGVYTVKYYLTVYDDTWEYLIENYEGDDVPVLSSCLEVDIDDCFVSVPVKIELPDKWIEYAMEHEED